VRKFFAIQLFVIVIASMGFAQSDASKFNFDIGGGVSFPLKTTSNVANSGGNFEVGGGLNMGKMLGFNGEFMWQDLPPKQSVIALTGAPNGSARLYSFTGNVIVHSPEVHKFGVYGISGIGWYHRSWDLTAPTLAIGTTCFPSFAFWGVVCTNGLVSATQTLKSGSTNGFGWNIGGGLTYRLGAHLKFYTEPRVHFAYLSHFNTRILPLTFGIRW
jgi:opacity protein-like surface antigen